VGNGRKGLGTNEENDERVHMLKPQEAIENGADIYGIIMLIIRQFGRSCKLGYSEKHVCCIPHLEG
jgi:hypothetical protein